MAYPKETLCPRLYRLRAYYHQPRSMTRSTIHATRCANFRIAPGNYTIVKVCSSFLRKYILFSKKLTISFENMIISVENLSISQQVHYLLRKYDFLVQKITYSKQIRGRPPWRSPFPQCRGTKGPSIIIDIY